MIVVDTGPIVALINDRDNQHVACTELLAHHPGPLLVPAPVFTEVCLLLERRRGTRAELAFLRDVSRGIFTIVDLTEADLDRISELVDAYSNLPLGTVDASVVAIAERLRVPTVATLDLRTSVSSSRDKSAPSRCCPESWSGQLTRQDQHQCT